MSRRQDQEPLAPLPIVPALQTHAKEQKRHPKKSNSTKNGKVNYSHNYQRLMRLGKKRTWDTAGINEYPSRNPPGVNLKEPTSAIQLIAQQPEHCPLSTHTSVRQWISETSDQANTPVSMAGEGSRPAIGAPQASKSISAISATSMASGQAGSQVFGANASTISGSETQSIFGTSASLSNPRSLSAISATSLASEVTSSQAFSARASTISGASSQSDSESIPSMPRTSASQISATKSVSSAGSNSQKHVTNASTSAPSRRESTELRYDLRNRMSTREGGAGPRLTATDIQKLLVIPKGLVTQKDCGKSKTGSRIVPPPPKERNHNGKQFDKTKPKMTVTELQKQFIIPKGLVTQKQYGKKAQTRTTNLFAKGCYAGRLVELMHFHRSEYSKWANATIREIRLLGSTEPLAVIEILSMSRIMRLQCAKCKVIFSNRTKSFFEYSSTRKQSLPGSCDSASGDDRTETMPLHDLDTQERQYEWAATWSGSGASLGEDGPLENNDKSASFPGLTSESTTGFESGHSEVIQAKDSEPRKEWRIFDGLQSEGLHQARTQVRLSPSSKNTQSSESSGSFEEHGQEFSSGTTSSARRGLLSGALDVPVDASHFKGLSAPDDITLVDKDERCYNAKEKETGADRIGNRRMKINGMKGSGTMDVEVQVIKMTDRTASGVSSIDDISSDSGDSLALVPLNPLRGIKGQQQQQQEKIIPLPMAMETEAPTFDLIFSNLFNHSTLRVADRVEIHEPCRPLTHFGKDAANRSDPAATCVWIVERYVIGWQKTSS
ncbi:MAG: hypothetical protein J3R72DRAFT_520660 [Linnemannia gamsii]|nr:MAG: hypothetical protein J3R72DRAFT_520660 [Linnemannia gamsii]